MRGQTFGTFAPPQQLCGSRVDTIHFGFGQHNDVVINVPHSTLSHTATAFLPDGTPCSPYGCSYRSALSFTDFAEEARIRSSQDIKYVRLNIEHSYMADIYINITCPNGQKANLMRFGGETTSNCQEAIPQGAKGWLDGDNVSEDTFLGQAYDEEDSSEPCNANANKNRPGKGWNYCWSNNTGSGYRYASGDGIIYRSGHAHNGRLDSSHVVAQSNFYHPDQSFSALTGCPLNGTWYIEVVDGYKYDNGYIFDWELALAPDLLPTVCNYASHTIECDWVRPLNDTTYCIEVPSNVQHDTVVEMRFIIVTTCGDTIDRVAQATVSIPKNTLILDTVVENQLPVRAFRRTLFYDDADTTVYYTSSKGCDSTVRYQLKVWKNVAQQLDTMVCGGFQSMRWKGVDFTHSLDTILRLHTYHGADSTVRLNFRVAPIYDMSLEVGICKGGYYRLGDEVLTDEGEYTARLTTIEGCDSLVGIMLKIYPHYADTVADTTCRTVGVDFEGQHYNTGGIFTHRYQSTQGCDSMRSIALTVWGENLRAMASISPAMASVITPVVSFADMSQGAMTIEWQVGNYSTAKRQFEMVFPEEEDSLEVRLVATDSNGCTDTFHTVVHIDRSAFYVPNVFMPSMEANSHWAPVANDMLKMEVWVYDRQGDIVYHHEGLDSSWDGTSHGRICQQGTYTYRIEYTRRLYPYERCSTVGTVTLLR